jgi:DNA-binding GntR family transcriptional regulator
VSEIADVLRERIYSGVYVINEHLPQVRLAEELGVSRTPLREAFRLLEQEGLVHLLPHRGARVVSGDRKRLLAAYEMRAVVDGLAARLSAARVTPAELQLLRTILERQRRATEPWNAALYTASNVEFHLQLMYFSDNSYVVGQQNLLRLTAQMFAPVAVLEPAEALRAIDEHTRILDAVAAGDGALAEQLAREHIQHTIDVISRDDPNAKTDQPRRPEVENSR